MGDTEARAQMKARVAWTSFASNMSGTWVAQEEGLFKKNGLDVELVHIPSTSRANEVMLAGELQYSYMDGRNSVTAALKGADVVIIAGVANRLVFSFMARPEIKSFADLKSRKIGITRLGSSTHSVTLWVMNKMGLKPEDGVRRRSFAPPSGPTTDAGDLADAESAVMGAVRDSEGVELDELKRLLKDVQGSARAIGSLIKSGRLARTYRLARPSVQAKAVAQVTLRIPEDEALSRARTLRDEGSAKAMRRAVILEALVEEGWLPLSRARAIGLTAAVLREFVGEGIVAQEEVAVLRDPLAGRDFTPKPPAKLTADQESATSAIIESLDSMRPGAPGYERAERAGAFLLHGVTGSGKTEVYLAAIDHAVALGKRAIVLVPEIALTPQTLRRFGERFPGEVAVMHSELSLGEHFDMWHAVREGRYRVVIGPRGALFAPQPDLGLIVIDEEHEWTYKQQEGSPRYHARKAAEELCRRTGAVLVLGSATPDVESHFRASAKAYRLLELPQRLIRRDGVVEPAPLPEVEVVDLREELKAGNRSIFSRSLARSVRAGAGQRTSR